MNKCLKCSCDVGVLQDSCTTTLRHTTVLSTWLDSAIYSPPSLCSWSHWLSAGRPDKNWIKPREQNAAVRPMAVLPLTDCRMALCSNEKKGRERPSILTQRAHDVSWASIQLLGPCTVVWRWDPSEPKYLQEHSMAKENMSTIIIVSKNIQ